MAIHLEIENLFSKYSFEQSDWDANSKRLQFKNEKYIIDVYLTKMTIGYKKINELSPFTFRKNLLISQIEDTLIAFTGHNMKDDTALDYWKKRCLLAEDFIKERTAPIDRPEEFHASEKWKAFKDKKPPN